MVRVRHTSAAGAKYHKLALRLGQQLQRAPGSGGVATRVFDGFLLRARKKGKFVTVDVIEAPGRLEGSNQYRGALDPVDGESTIDGVVVSTAPSLGQMSPLTENYTAAFSQTPSPGAIGPTLSLGEPLPANPFLLYPSFSVEFDGGVIFPHFYVAERPPLDSLGNYLVTDQTVWLAVLVRWAGSGPTRSLTLSDAWVRAATDGYDFYPRQMLSGVAPLRYGARLPACHYADGRLSLAVEVERPGGGNSTVGALLGLGVSYTDGAPVLDWQRLIDVSDIPPELAPDVFLDPDVGPYQVAGFDLPAVFAWRDAEAQRGVLTARYRGRRAAGASYRIVTGQVRMDVVDGTATVGTDYLDGLCGADSPLPQGAADKVLIQKYRDEFFLAGGGLVRHRKLRALVRPPTDGSIPSAAPTRLPIHADRTLMLTEHLGVVTAQTQGALGYGVEEVAAGDSDSNAGNNIANIGWSTLVAPGELWTWGWRNTGLGVVVTIVRVTGSGVVGALGSLPESAHISTYQVETRDAQGETVVPMGQVVTALDLGNPFVAIKKGRLGAIDFLPAAAYSRFGTFYLASPLSTPKYGRMFE